jgi:phosphoribosylanthranilate isomerase
MQLEFFPHSKNLSVKICGITMASQVEAIFALGADAIGINFWRQSKRYLDPSAAIQWLPNWTSKHNIIAVTVNALKSDILSWYQQGLFNQLQLHGDETPQDVCHWLNLGIPVIKAIQVRDEYSLSQIDTYPCQTILLDAYQPQLYGGGGTTFPWSLFQLAQQRYPNKKLILSGGLTPTNIQQAIDQTQALSYDVASGVESSPGIKDLSLTSALINIIKNNNPHK